jgi:hypothetical protein
MGPGHYVLRNPCPYIWTVLLTLKDTMLLEDDIILLLSKITSLEIKYVWGFVISQN